MGFECRMKTPTYSTWNAEFPAYKCTRNKGPDSVGDHGKQIQRRQPVHRSPESRRTDVLLKTLRIRRGLHHCLRSRSPRTSLMKGSKGVSLWGLARAKVKVPLVFFYCTLFFLAGFYGSLLFSPVNPLTISIFRFRSLLRPRLCEVDCDFFLGL